MDALRLLVFFGLVLWMIPMAWLTGDDGSGAPVAMSHAVFYVFGVWIVLIVAAFLLARRLTDATADEKDGTGDTS